MSDISPIVSNVSKKNKRIAFMGKIFILYFNEYGFFYIFSRFSMHFAIGTTNTPKSVALQHVLTLFSPTKTATISNHRVPSWVPDIPTTLEAMRTGAVNRAINCRKEMPDADYFVGMEGGVYRDYEGEEYWYLGVVYIEDAEWKWYWGYSGHLRVPDRVVALLFDGRGLDLEQVMHELSGVEHVWDKEGSGAIWSDGFLTRQEQFIIATKCAIVPHFSQYYR